MSSTDALWEELAGGKRQDERVARLLNRSMASNANTKKAAIARSAAKSFSAYVIKTTAVDNGSVRLASPLSSRQRQTFNLQRELNRLASEVQSERKCAALELEEHYLSQSSNSNRVVKHKDTETNTAEEDDDALSLMAKPLFRRFNDRVEKVREVSIRLATSFLAHEDDLLRYLPYLIPAITARIDSPFVFDEQQNEFSRDAFLLEAFKRGRVLVDATELKKHHDEQRKLKENLSKAQTKSVKEPSEEIRLLLLRLIHAVLHNALVRLRAGSILHAYAFDIILILVACAHDDYHDLAIESCAILELLSDNLVSVIKHFSVALVRSLAPKLLLHRLSRVRIAGIGAIRALVTCPDPAKCKGSGTEAIVDLLGYCDENVIPVAAFYGSAASSVRVNYFAKLGQDPNSRVRIVFLEMVSDWMLNLPDRYDHESRLLPYLLNGLGDDLPDMTQLAMSTLRELGDRYEREQGEEVLEMKQYGVDGKNPTYNYNSPLPSPFESGRPSLGTRLFVRARAKRFLNPVLREVGNWQQQTRARALRLLSCVLILCEESVTSELHLLISTLIRTWPRPGVIVLEAGEIVLLRQIAQLTGRFTAPDTYMQLLLARVRGDEDVSLEASASTTVHTSSVKTTVALEVLGCIMSGSLDRTLLPHTLEVLETMTLPHIFELESDPVRRALSSLLAMITQLLDRRGTESVSAYFLQRGRLPDVERVRQRIFELGNLLLGAAANNAMLQSVAEEAQLSLKLLVKIESCKSIKELYNARGPHVLERVTNELHESLATQWSPQCASQLAFEQVLRLMDSSAIFGAEPLGERFCSLFESVLGPADKVKTCDTQDEDSSASNRPRPEPSGATRRSQYTRILSDLLDRIRLSEASDGGDAGKCESRLEALARAAIA